MELAVIAEELTAVGWRLAGARVYVAEGDAAGACLEIAARSADLILLTAELARHVPPLELEEALRSAAPLLLIIADVQHTREPPDIELEARRALGIGA
jgi:vacuolar-type H+-ATPase subunit F/Vma7